MRDLQRMPTSRCRRSQEAENRTLDSTAQHASGKRTQPEARTEDQSDDPKRSRLAKTVQRI